MTASPPRVTRAQVRAVGTSCCGAVLALDPSGRVTVTTPDGFLAGVGGRVILTRTEIDQAGIRFIPGSGRLARGSAPLLGELVAGLNRGLAGWLPQTPKINAGHARRILPPHPHTHLLLLQNGGLAAFTLDEPHPVPSRVVLTREQLDHAGIHVFISGRFTAGSAQRLVRLLADCNRRAGHEVPRPCDSLLAEAAVLVVSTQAISYTAIQRELHVGFAVATHLIETLHDLGVVGPPRESKARKVLVPPEQLETVLDKIRAGQVRS